MMQQLTINMPRKQHGITLIEAMISMLIIAITTAGSLYVVSRANVAKTQMSLEALAVEQMRAALLNHDGASLGNGNICITPPVLSLPGVDVQPRVTVSGCNPTTGSEVKVDGFIVKLPTETAMSGRLVLTASNAGTAVLSGDITVGGA